jgi:hypothetical protein
MTTYNGWTNYATWRVNLEVFDGLSLTEFTSEDAADVNTYELGKELSGYAEDLIFIDTPEGLARDYALTFLQDVNWYEIAEHLIEAVEA